MTNIDLSPTRSAVRKAGSDLRKLILGRATDEPRYFEAIEVITAWRASHQYPLMKATSGLRSMVQTVGADVIVSQRLKRVPTIIDKLIREPSIDSSRMQDYGGCRAVLSSIDEIRAVQSRLGKAHRERCGRDPHPIKDYVTRPKPSGYRGVHVVVNYNERLIEVQLRTRVMHEWAIAMETLSGRFKINLKAADAPIALRNLYAEASRLMALEETGASVEQVDLEHFAVLQERAVEFLSSRES